MTALREAPVATLEDIANEWTVSHSKWGGPLSNIAVDLLADKPLIKLGDREVPATKQGLITLGNYVGVPGKFLERIMPDEQQFILDRRIERTAETNTTVSFSDAGLHEVYKSDQLRLDPGEIIEAILSVMPAESMVRDAILTQDVLRVDLVMPEGVSAFWGGDKKVNDLTGGGLRVGQDRKHNLAPWTQRILYRLICTNGMQITDPQAKIDARGKDEMEILSELRAEMRRGLDRVAADIEAFYELRSHKVDKDYTGVLRRMALDAGLPDRTVGRLENLLPAEIDGQSEVTMFDLANVMTNAANLFDPVSASFLNLQMAGGGVIGDHSSRCSNCHRRVA